MEEPFTPERLVERYPGAQVKLGGIALTLEQALAAEAMFCPARDADKDELRRVGYLAFALHKAGSLQQEDMHLLDLRSPETQGQ